MGLSKFRTTLIPGASGLVANIPPAPGNFAGFSVYNTGANVCTIEFYDSNTTAAGNLLGVVTLTATGTVGSSLTVFFGDDGVAYFKGVFANYIGTTPAPKGSVLYA